MSFSRLVVFLCGPLLGASSLLAQGPRTSGHYSIGHESLDAAGGSTASAHYAQTTVIAGNPAGLSASGYANASLGFTGQITQPVLLALSPPSPSVAEGGTLQLQAILLLDDGTVLKSGFTPQWQLIAGPLSSISPAGRVSAARVYADASAAVGATFGQLQASTLVQVTNVSSDDFGLYAGDGVNDGWQVRWFGTNNPLGPGSADASKTGQSNLFKYHAGLDPLDPASRFNLSIAWDPVSKRPEITCGPCFEGRVYELWRSPNLIQWEKVSSASYTTGPDYLTFIDSPPAGALRYSYRIDVLKNP